MTKYKIISQEPQIIVNEAKKINDFKIRLKTGRGKNYLYEETILFSNICYTNDYIVGFLPFQKSSINLTEFNSSVIKYKNYNCHLIYFSNERYVVLRSNLSNQPFSISDEQKDYEKVNWLSSCDKWKLLFTSSDNLINDEEKKDLIKKVKSGSDLKLRFSYNNFHYVLKPYINHFFINQNGNDELSCKIHPIILFNNDINSFEEVELMFNTSGQISILTKNIYNNLKINKNNLISKIFKKISNLISQTVVKHRIINGKIEWYIRED